MGNRVEEAEWKVAGVRKGAGRTVGGSNKIDFLVQKAPLYLLFIVFSDSGEKMLENSH